MQHKNKEMPPILCGIAGSNGKSMSGFLLKHILDQAGYKGAFVEAWSRGKSIFQLLDYYKKNGNDWLGIEISEQGLLKKAYRNLPFSLTLLTNLYPYPKSDISTSVYLDLKRNFLAQQSKDNITVINADDSLALGAVNQMSGQIITYSLEYPKTMVTIDNYLPHSFGSSFQIIVNNELPLISGGYCSPTSFQVYLPLPGMVGVYTALAAITCALVLGLQKEDIVQGIKSFPGVRRRFEVLHNNDFLILDDIAPDPQALKFLFESLTTLEFKRISVIYNLVKRKERIIKKIARELLKQEKHYTLTNIFLTANTEYLVPANSPGRQEEQAFLETWQKENGKADISVFQTLSPALEEAIFFLQKGDLLLLLGGKEINPAGQLVADILQNILPIKNKDHLPSSGTNNSPWQFFNPT